MIGKPKIEFTFSRKYLILFVALAFLGSAFIAGCSHISALRKITPEANSFLALRYPASPPTLSDKVEQRIPLIDGYDEENYELYYSKKDFYRLKNWKWNPAGNLKIELEDGYLLIGYTPRGATAAVILPKGKLLLFEKESTNWEKISAANLYMRFPADELGNIFSGAFIENSEDSEQFSQAAKVVKYKIWNWFCSSAGKGTWKVFIPESGNYSIDIDTPEVKRLSSRIKNNKAQDPFSFLKSGKKTPLGIFPLRALGSPSLLEIKIQPSQAKENFELVWDNFDRTYPSFVRKGIDWNAIKKQYEPRVSQATTVGEFLDIIKEMLSQLKDSHVRINTPEGQLDTYDTYNPEVDYSNYNFKALRKYMKSIEQVGNSILVGQTDDNLAYAAFTSWNPSVGEDVEKLKESLPDIINSRGMIVDVRANYGGNETLAKGIAALFTDEPIVYARSQFRNGPLHTDLTKPSDRILEPNKERIYYSKPVVLLIGQECASSNESFISAMNQLPQVTLVGDRTAGSSGNPTFVELNLPVKVSVSIPQWIDLLPDGTPLEKEGIKPDVFVNVSKEDFSGDNDPVLKRGVELLTNKLEE